MNSKATKKTTKLKVFLGIITLLMVATIGGIVFLAVSIMSIQKEYPSKEIIMGQGAKKALIIYEPGRSDVAEDISTGIGNIFVKQGYTVTMNRPSKTINYDWNDYQVIALGSAVYIGQVSPVLKEYVQRNKVEGKKILLYAIGSGAPAKESEVDSMNQWIVGKNTIDKMKCRISEKNIFEAFVEKTVKQWNTNK